jgi:DNA-directed RNA polymerase specialized sigma24 family protein
MSTEGSVTHWLTLLKAGDREAVQPLWERYFRLLATRAQAALARAPRPIADGEDVALSAFDSFCRNAERGRFPRLNDRHGLWRLLLHITARKAAHLIRDEGRARRGGGQVCTWTDFRHDDGEAFLPDVVDAEPTPELAAQAAEEYRLLLNKLGHDDLRAIAVCQMEGYTVDEIAAQLECSPRTVARKLVLIRDLWNREVPPS